MIPRRNTPVLACRSFSVTQSALRGSKLLAKIFVLIRLKEYANVTKKKMKQKIENTF